jgi:hypothetical protein
LTFHWGRLSVSHCRSEAAGRPVCDTPPVVSARSGAVPWVVARASVCDSATV